MKFHDFIPTKTRHLADDSLWDWPGGRQKRAYLKKLSPREFLTKRADKIIEQYAETFSRGPGSTADDATIFGSRVIDTYGQIAEMDWFDDNRPFYNVYPVVEKLVRNTKLDVPVADLNFPRRALCFRFAKGHEPLGINTALIKVGAYNSNNATLFKTALQLNLSIFDWPLMSGAYTVNEDDKERALYFVRPPQNVDINGKAITIEQMCAINVAANKFVLEENAFVLKENAPPESARHHAREMFLLRLVVFISLLADGDDLITPAILAADQEKYTSADAEARRWLEKRAETIQGRGFDFGKTLQTESETSPHWRNPHRALYWTGPGRTKPMLLKRQGCVVMPKHLAEVPTGFDCPLTTEDATPKTEHVYFLREPARGFVKIGRTRRAIADRQRESSTFVPNGLKLLGFIQTGDCVQLETRIHRELADKRRANEFFELADSDVVRVVRAYGGQLADDFGQSA